MEKEKNFSKSYIFLSLLYIAAGIVFLAYRSMSVRTIGIGLGVIMLVIGVTYGFIFFTGTRKREKGLLQLDLIIGIICVAFGIFILLNPDIMSMIFPFAMALLLLIGAIVKIYNTLSLRKLLFRFWYVFLIMAAVIIALGVILLCLPFAEEYMMLIYIGICLIIDGTTNLASMICIYASSSKITKMQEQNPGADIKAMIKSERKEAAREKAEKRAAKKIKKEIVQDAVFVEPEDSGADDGSDSSEDKAEEGCSAVTESDETLQSPAVYDNNTGLSNQDDR